MERREFLALIGVAALSGPLRAHAQARTLPVAGFLTTRAQLEAASHTAAFLRGLKEAGYVDGHSVVMELRWAEGHYERLPALANELVGLRPAVLVAGGDPAALAAKAAAINIPVVFIMGGDPVRMGLVASLNRPGGNATGVSLITSALGAKRAEFLCELVPKTPVAVFVNPDSPNADAHSDEVSSVVRPLGRSLQIVRARTDADIQAGFAALASAGGWALVIQNDPFFDAKREQFLALATRYSFPAIYHIREFPLGGGLLSYGPSLADGYHQLGVRTGLVLKGAKPEDLPVVRPTRFELVVNVKTAQALGLEVPTRLLALADELIE